MYILVGEDTKKIPFRAQMTCSRNGIHHLLTINNLILSIATTPSAYSKCRVPIRNAMCLSDMYLSADLGFFAVDFWQVYHKHTVGYACSNLVTIDIVGKNERLLEIGVGEVAAQIVYRHFLL